MAKDYKPAQGRSTAGGGKGGGMNPMFAGILIGLMLGIMLALGIALWLNRANNPFVEKAKPVEALPTLPPKTTPGKPEAAADGDKPRFEFYQTLPGEKDGAGHARKAADAAKPATEGKAAPESKPAIAPPSAVKEAGKEPAKEPVKETVKEARETYYLQAGAFQNESDAENLKAKVAFAGMEANVRPVNVPDKGTLYRVRLGPYRSLEEVNRIKSTLSQSGIAASVVKGD
jgi:cell division protein FtsN